MAGSMCYFLQNSTLLSANTFDYCSSAPSCCNIGDLCLPDAFCYTVNHDSNMSGYYIGACSDSSFPSPNCATHCGQYQAMSLLELEFNFFLLFQKDGHTQMLCIILPPCFGRAVSIPLKTLLTAKTLATRPSLAPRQMCPHRLLLR